MKSFNATSFSNLIDQVTASDLFKANQHKAFKVRLFCVLVWLFGIAQATAARITEQTVTDWIASGGNKEASIKFGAITKSGLLTIGESIKGKSITATPAFRIARMAQAVDGLLKDGILVANSKFAMTDEMVKLVAEFADK